MAVLIKKYLRKDSHYYSLVSCDYCHKEYPRRRDSMSKFCNNCARRTTNRMGKDIVGKKYGRLTVVSFSKIIKNHSHWLCKCDCGKIKTIARNNLVSGSTEGCGCFQRRKGLNHPLTKRPYKKMPNSYWNQIKKGAKVRGVIFNISKKYAYSIFEKQNECCALSGIQLHFSSYDNRYDGTVSLDRINSDLGYINGNIQWIHKDINKMKWAFSNDFFIKTCQKIAEHNS